MTIRIVIDIVAMLILCGISYGIGYKAAKRFAVLMVRRELQAIPAARVIGAIVGRSAERVQRDLGL